MAGEGRLLVEVLDGVGLVTFCGRGVHNAVVPAIWRGLTEAVARLEADAAVSVLVLTGAGHTAFATDPAEPDPAFQRYGEQVPAEHADPGRAGCARLRACAKPVVARLRGECTGAGVAVALSADIRIASADAVFALTGERAASLGVERALVQAVGLAHARYLLMTGERIEAPEALRIGLVTRVVPDADLSDTVADLARQLQDRDVAALRAAKRALAVIAGG